jgi:hypothetical protein
MNDKFRELLGAEMQRHPECLFEWTELGKHRGVRVTWRGRSRTVTLSRSASDHRAALNARTDLRRTIAFLKGEI